MSNSRHMYWAFFVFRSGSSIVLKQKKITFARKCINFTNIVRKLNPTLSVVRKCDFPSAERMSFCSGSHFVRFNHHQPLASNPPDPAYKQLQSALQQCISDDNSISSEIVCVGLLVAFWDAIGKWAIKFNTETISNSQPYTVTLWLCRCPWVCSVVHIGTHRTTNERLGRFEPQRH